MRRAGSAEISATIKRHHNARVHTIPRLKVVLTRRALGAGNSVLELESFEKPDEWKERGKERERERAPRIVHGHRMALARIRSFVNIQRWRTADYTSRGAARAEGSRRQETLPRGTESWMPIGFQLSVRPTVRPLEMSKYRRSRKSKLSFPAHLRVRPNPKPGKVELGVWSPARAKSTA
jgi:hypothetical protein